jgi:hypothetical protein
MRMFCRQTLHVTTARVIQTLKLFSCLVFLSLFISNCRSNNDAGEDLETDGADRAMHQEFLMTRDPALNTVPKERLLTAIDYMNSQRTTQPTALAWQERGPNNIGGRTRAIMIDKRDPTGNTVFAGSVSGGIFKTTNFLTASPTWTAVNDAMANLSITILLQDKANLNTMYAGTGEGWFNIDAVRGAGVFRSTDGGTTWSQMASTAGFEYVQDMIIDNNNNLYVALRNLTSLNRGVMRSIDGGASWTQVLGLPLTDFAYTTGRAADLELASNGDIYATLGIFTRTMVMKSSFAANGALTGAPGHWTEITPPHTTVTFRGEIAVAPNNAQRVYLMMQDSTNDQVDSFYRSNDGGASWTPFLAPSALNNGANSQTWYDLTMAVDSNNADVVVVGGLQLAKSTDGGTSWSTITAAPVHVDQHYVVYFNSTRLLLGNDGGLYYSNDLNLPSPSWNSKNFNGYSVTQFYGCDFHPTDDNYFLAGAQDNNTQKFTIAGLNSTAAVVGGDGGVPHIHQTDGLIQIAATTGNNYYRSTTGGTAFAFLSTVSNNRGQFIQATDYDQTNNILYCGDDAGQYYVITGLAGTPTGTIKTISGTIASREVTAVKVDPTTPSTVWLGCSLGNAVPMVCKISNASTSPSIDLSTQLTGVAAGAYISSIDVDPANANNVLVTLSNYGIASVWLSTNGGTSYVSLDNNGVILPDMPVHWGIFAPSSAILNGTTGGGILLGTELGVWTTSVINGPSTVWVANNSGLANVPVYMLRYKSSSALVAAATHGRGLFTTVLPGVATGVSNNVITKDFIKYISADQSRLLIVKGNLATKKMQVQIFDASGKLVYDQNKPYQDASINITAFSSGSYTVRMMGNNKEYYVRQFVKTQ